MVGWIKSTAARIHSRYTDEPEPGAAGTILEASARKLLEVPKFQLYDLGREAGIQGVIVSRIDL